MYFSSRPPMSVAIARNAGGRMQPDARLRVATFGSSVSELERLEASSPIRGMIQQQALRAREEPEGGAIPTNDVGLRSRC